MCSVNIISLSNFFFLKLIIMLLRFFFYFRYTKKPQNRINFNHATLKSIKENDRNLQKHHKSTIDHINIIHKMLFDFPRDFILFQFSGNFHHLRNIKLHRLDSILIGYSTCNNNYFCGPIIPLLKTNRKCAPS